MYKVDIKAKSLSKLETKKFGEMGIWERFDIQEWVEKSPDILDEELLIIGKELPVSQRNRLDLLAIDRQANLVIIELKRDESGSDVEWQAIKYASYCSNFLPEDIISHYAQYLKTDIDNAQTMIEEFIDDELENLNQHQRIILVSKEFHSDVISAVLWLRDGSIEIKCVRLRSYLDSDGSLFLNPEVIIPLPEAKDYIERKEVKQQSSHRSLRSSFSLEKGDFTNNELESRIRDTLARKSDLTPRLVCLLEILVSESKTFSREEIRRMLFDKGIGKDVGQSGRYLSNLSQFLTKKSNPHLRQVVEFETGGAHGEMKDNYRILPEYEELIRKLVSEWRENNS
ncbi:MAG: hypothetical protein C3F07_03900 [Anaerolineales bacterium]|nr:MAG: hypothetical protein C3F07_03900 [Anaerolineales bacterium]